MKITIQDAKVGQRVILTSNQWGDDTINPIWGGSQGHVAGTVASVETNCIYVKWDNGIHNTYTSGDLEAEPVTSPIVTLTPTQTTVISSVASQPTMTTLSLKDAVEKYTNEFVLRSDTFSAYDVTKKLRELVNTGAIGITDLTNEIVDGINTQRIVHADVRAIVARFIRDVPAYTKRLNASGDYIEYTTVVPTPVRTPSVTVTPSGIVGTPGALAAMPSIAPAVFKITKEFVTGRKSVTLKKLQSRIKHNAPTVRELEKVATSLGFKVTPAIPYYLTQVSV